MQTNVVVFYKCRMCDTVEEYPGESNTIPINDIFTLKPMIAHSCGGLTMGIMDMTGFKIKEVDE